MSEKNRKCPLQLSKLFSITLIVWSAPADGADVIFHQFLKQFSSRGLGMQKKHQNQIGKNLV
jgi:hypothetical protein